MEETTTQQKNQNENEENQSWIDGSAAIKAPAFIDKGYCYHM